MELVAEFHVHRIRPSRIAYRLGIDIAQVEAWLSGEQDAERFQRLMAAHRQKWNSVTDNTWLLNAK